MYFILIGSTVQKRRAGFLHLRAVLGAALELCQHSSILTCKIQCFCCRGLRQLSRSDCWYHWLLPTDVVVFWCAQFGAEERPPKPISTCDLRQGLNSSFRWKMASVPLAFCALQLRGFNTLRCYWVKCCV